MVHLLHKNHKNSIWKWSGFHLKKLAKSQKTEKSIKNSKKLKFETKNIRRYCIEEYLYQIGVDWRIFRYRNYDTISVTHTKRSHNHTLQTYNLLIILFFRRCENPPKKVSAQSEKITVCPFGRIIIPIQNSLLTAPEEPYPKLTVN